MNKGDPEAWMREHGMSPIGETSARLQRPAVGIDAYRSANILIRQHGMDAERVADERLEALLDAGDEGGVAAWTDIAYAIGELRRGPRPGEPRN